MPEETSSPQKSPTVKQRLGAKIAGEIVMSDSPAKALKKWREIFKTQQNELAKSLKVKPSVISDYESGRRKSPGTVVVRRVVEALISLDELKGSQTIFEFSNMLSGDAIFEIILDIKEFQKPAKVKDFIEACKGTLITGTPYLDRDVFGYTVIDSIRAIVEFSPLELAKIYGSTTQRALVFSKITSGRSPMIAIKLTSLKPAVVIFHGPQEVDKLAVKIAETEKIPVILSNYPTVDELVASMRSKF
ncbi:MAG: helix-turn-helix domain-containing protein [archaeon]